MAAGPSGAVSTAITLTAHESHAHTTPSVPSVPLCPPRAIPHRVLPCPRDAHSSSHTSSVEEVAAQHGTGVFNRWSARTWRGHQDSEL